MWDVWERQILLAQQDAKLYRPNTDWQCRPNLAIVIDMTRYLYKLRILRVIFCAYLTRKPCENYLRIQKKRDGNQNTCTYKNILRVCLLILSTQWYIKLLAHFKNNFVNLKSSTTPKVIYININIYCTQSHVIIVNRSVARWTEQQNLNQMTRVQFPAKVSQVLCK